MARLLAEIDRIVINIGVVDKLQIVCEIFLGFGDKIMDKLGVQHPVLLLIALSNPAEEHVVLNIGVPKSISRQNFPPKT